MQTLLAVAAGGAFGALLRHGANAAIGTVLGTGFPWGTMTINVAGSFLMGVLAAWFSAADLSPALRAFAAAGVLGGFTTFSAFSLDAAQLLQRGEIAGAGVYVLGSVVLSIGGLCVGMTMMRAVLA